MAPVDMRYFAARDGKPADYCRQRVRECEIYVAVIGFRYGSRVPGGAVSYTELEFDEASTAGLPRLVFMLDKPAGMSAKLVDADQGAAEGFRQRLRRAGLLVRAFTSPAALELEVFHALTEVSVRSAVQGTALTAPPGNVIPGPLPRGIAAATRTLPRDLASFTGREPEIESVLTAVAGAGAGGVVDICAIDGMAGIGKTALAVHVAHRLSGRFADGQVFLQLHGHTPGQSPVDPADALASLLQACGIPAQSIPDGLEPRAWLWRDRLAGRRMLLVLDNAAGSSQVVPLLPGDGECLVLVTSRRHLGDLPGSVTPVLLDVLTPSQAAQMFTRLAPRAVGSPGEVADVVRLAGFLPLAVSLLARLSRPAPVLDAGRPGRRDQGQPADPDPGARQRRRRVRGLLPSPGPGPAAVLLPAGPAPGNHHRPYAAAALAGTSLDEAAGLLDVLHGEGLLTETGHRRYGMHDLLRRYARDHAAAGPASAAGGGAAAGLLPAHSRPRRRPPGPPDPARPSARRPGRAARGPGPAGHGQALAWVRADRANLLACLDHATAAGQHARVIALTAGIAGLLRRDGPWADAITRHAAAVQAAQHAGDRLGQANALTDLGNARRLAGDYPGAAQALEQALGIYRDLGNRLGQANALNYLGNVRRRDRAIPRRGRGTGAGPGHRTVTSATGAARPTPSTNSGRVGAAGRPPGRTEALEQARHIYRDPATGAARPTPSNGRKQRCTGSAVTSHRLRDATSRPWNWPALSPACGTRLTRWPAWAEWPWPAGTPPRPRPCFDRRWRYSSGSAQPRPPACSPNLTPSPAKLRSIGHRRHNIARCSARQHRDSCRAAAQNGLIWRGLLLAHRRTVYGSGGPESARPLAGEAGIDCPQLAPGAPSRFRLRGVRGHGVFLGPERGAPSAVRTPARWGSKPSGQIVVSSATAPRKMAAVMSAALKSAPRRSAR